MHFCKQTKILNACVCVCVCMNFLYNRGKHDAFGFVRVELEVPVGYSCRNIQHTGIKINSLVSGMEIKIEDHQHALPLDCYGSVDEEHLPSPGAYG